MACSLDLIRQYLTAAPHITNMADLVKVFAIQYWDRYQKGEIYNPQLLEHYYEINAGVGVHKSPSLYGAFPTDPYSHTPGNRGAQQPGMTGQVKEDILSRFGELGVFVANGSLYFNPCLLRKDEFVTQDRMFNYVTVNKEHKTFAPPLGSLCFTFCQVPVIYRLSNENRLEIGKKDGTLSKHDSLLLDKEMSTHIFNRTGEIANITVYIKESILK